MQRAWELQIPVVVCVAPPFRSTQPEKVKQLHLSRQQQKLIVGRNDDVFSPVISRVPSWPLATFAAARPMFGGELNNTFVHNVWRVAAGWAGYKYKHGYDCSPPCSSGPGTEWSSIIKMLWPALARCVSLCAISYFDLLQFNVYFNNFAAIVTCLTASGAEAAVTT